MELGKLINTTIEAKQHHGFTGKQRAMLYILAVNTGFRASELASLSWNNFDFNDISPTVTIEATYSKHRRKDTQPLRIDVSKLFEHWQYEVNAKSKDKLFTIPKFMKWADMLKIDLEEAGIDYIDDNGKFFDFHSFRHTFITNLVKGGVSPKIAQGLARQIQNHFDHGYLYPFEPT